MRNHLAEEVLSTKMLYLLQVHSASTSTKVFYLSPAPKSFDMDWECSHVITCMIDRIQIPQCEILLYKCEVLLYIILFVGEVASVQVVHIKNKGNFGTNLKNVIHKLHAFLNLSDKGIPLKTNVFSLLHFAC